MEIVFKNCTKASVKAIKSGIIDSNTSRRSGGQICQWVAAKCANGKCIEYCIDLSDRTIHYAKIISERKKIEYGC